MTWPIAYARCEAHDCRRVWRLRRIDCLAPGATGHPDAPPDHVHLNLCPKHLRWWAEGDGVALQHGDEPWRLVLEGKPPNLITMVHADGAREVVQWPPE